MTGQHYSRASRSLGSRLIDWTSEVSASWVFWLVLFVKLVAMTSFASSYLTDLFIPFLERFAAEPWQNPYQYFWQAGSHANFPYPAAMLFILGIPRAVLAFLGVETMPLGLQVWFYRLPLLAADLTIFLVLCRWMRSQVRLILLLYWASPVLFYISYLHGQLDVIPVALLFLAIYCLFSGRELLAACVLGLALATKTHIAVVLPFIVVYLWQRTGGLSASLRFAAVALAVFVAINLPYAVSEGFLRMVFFNPEQAKVMLARISTSGGDLSLYVVPAIMLLLVAYSILIHITNRDLLMTFVGFSFGVILLFVPPNQGWYFWVIPAFVYFFARSRYAFVPLLFLLQIAYLIYFGLTPLSDYASIYLWGNRSDGYLYRLIAGQGVDADFVLNLAYTALQTMLLLCCAVVYYRGIYLPQRHKLTATPFLVGISGDSGAGKSTLSSGLQNLFGERIIDIFCGDDMHKWQRGHDRWTELTHLNPRANHLHDELRYLTLLKQNRAISRRHYDHTTGHFTDEALIKPRPIMVLEGLHAFYLKPAREILDLKVFVKPDPDLLLHRKIVRDTGKRNYTREQILESVRRRQADSSKYIDVQEAHADVVISLLPRAPIADVGNVDIEVDEWLRFAATNVHFLDPLVDDLAEILGGSLRHYYDDRDMQVLEFDRPIDAADLLALGERHLSMLEDMGIYNPGWLGGWHGTMQLLIAYCIFHGLEDRSHA